MHYAIDYLCFSYNQWCMCACMCCVTEKYLYPLPPSVTAAQTIFLLQIYGHKINATAANLAGINVILSPDLTKSTSQFKSIVI